MKRRKADLGKWDSSYPDASPKRPVKINYPWFQDHDGNPYFAEPDPRIFDPGKVTPALQNHARLMWDEYHRMRLTKLPSEYGLGHTGLPFEKFAVIYQKQADLSTPEMNNLLTYMMGIRWVTSTMYKSWKYLLKRNELNQVRTPKWYTLDKHEAPEVSLASARKRGEGRRTFPSMSRKRLSKQLEKRAPIDRVEYLLKYLQKLEESGKVGPSDLGEIKETLDYQISLVGEDESGELEKLLTRYDYVPKQKVQSRRSGRRRRKQAIPWKKRGPTDVWDVSFVFDEADWKFEKDLKSRARRQFGRSIEFAGSGAGPDGRDMEWFVEGERVDEFLDFVETTAAEHGVGILDRKFQTAHDREREEQEFVDRYVSRKRRRSSKMGGSRCSRRRASRFGDSDIIRISIEPTTTTDSIYQQVEDAMMDVANNRAEGFRLGRYDVVYADPWWEVYDINPNAIGPLATYSDDAHVHFDIVDDWMHDGFGTES